MRKQFVAPAIHYKGSGWAKKDRGSARTGTKASAGSGGSRKADGSSSDGAGSSSDGAGSPSDSTGSPSDSTGTSSDSKGASSSGNAGAAPDAPAGRD